ncbi:hypothetical protein FRAHR75_10169 [Frankia sp. Hr75.2]|nr:hypothetical protein FRAHR75_10169 [Frankia sp. Hr75.2]
MSPTTRSVSVWSSRRAGWGTRARPRSTSAPRPARRTSSCATPRSRSSSPEVWRRGGVGRGARSARVGCRRRRGRQGTEVVVVEPAGRPFVHPREDDRHDQVTQPGGHRARGLGIAVRDGGLHHFPEPVAAQPVVDRQRVARSGPPAELPREDDGVLQRHRRALPGAHRMGRVADQDDPAVMVTTHERQGVQERAAVHAGRRAQDGDGPLKENLLQALLADMHGQAGEAMADGAMPGAGEEPGDGTEHPREHDLTDRAQMRAHLAVAWRVMRANLPVVVALYKSAITRGVRSDALWEQLVQDTAVLREHLEYLRDRGHRLPGEPVLVAAAMGGAAVDAGLRPASVERGRLLRRGSRRHAHRAVARRCAGRVAGGR